MGSSMPASVMTPKKRMANTNIAATLAVCLDARENEPAGTQAEARSERGRRRNEDERDERRQPSAQDERQKDSDGGEAGQREHC